MKLPYERSTAFDDFGNFVWDVLVDEATHTTDYSDCVFVCVCIARTHTYIVVQNMFVVIHAELSIRVVYCTPGFQNLFSCGSDCTLQSTNETPNKT